MSKQIERGAANTRAKPKALRTPPAIPVDRLAAVNMNISSVQYAGATLTPEGELPSWRVTFQLDSEYLLGTSFTIQAVGPSDDAGARQEAIAMLRRLARDLLGAAEKFSF